MGSGSVLELYLAFDWSVSCILGVSICDPAFQGQASPPLSQTHGSTALLLGFRLSQRNIGENKTSRMAPSAQSHSRSHSLLLVQKLLNLRDSASPLTLVLDTVEQTASPLLREFMSRAKVSQLLKVKVVTVA